MHRQGEVPMSKKGRARMEASLVQQAEKLRMTGCPGSNRELQGWGVAGGWAALIRKMNHHRGATGQLVTPELCSAKLPSRCSLITGDQMS